MSELFRQVVELLDSGVIVLDHDARVVSWNHWMEQHSGLSQPQVIGRNLFDIFPGLVSSRIELAVRKALVRQSPSLLSSKLLDAGFPLFRRMITGRRKPERLVQSVVIKPLIPADGAACCVISVLDLSSSDLRERTLRSQSNVLGKLVLDLQQKEQQLGTLFANSQIGILIFDHAGVVQKANPAATRIYGVGAEELDGRQIRDLLREMRSGLQDCSSTDIDIGPLLPGAHDELEMTGIRPDGSYVPLAVTANSIPIDGQPTRYFVFVRDITDQKHAEEQLFRMARYDSLTGLYNRLSFSETLSRALISHNRQHTSLSVFFIDLDRFKNVNDKLGHKAGDQLLYEVGQRLQDCCRDSDTVGRWSGDEFVVLLPQQNHQRSAITVAEKILAAVGQPFYINDNPVFINCSIGIAQYPDDGTSAERLIFCSDQAMYQAKADGKGMFRFFTPEMNERTIKRLQIEAELREALDHGQMELYYQPQIDVSSGCMVGVEALVRWHHPQRGLVYPSDFIHIAEECGLISRLGNWAMTQAFETASRWYKREGNPLTMSINLSPRQFVDESLVYTVGKLVSSIGFPPERIVLEITESHLMGDSGESMLAIRALKSLGVRIAIDDFGTGYSSLAYLRKLPVDIIKIDRHFLQGAATNPVDANIVCAIIELAHALNLEVIAEGIEHFSQMDLLRIKGCDQAQGYYIGHPMPLTELFEWYQGNHAGTSNQL